MSSRDGLSTLPPRRRQARPRPSSIRRLWARVLAGLRRRHTAQARWDLHPPAMPLPPVHPGPSWRTGLTPTPPAPPPTPSPAHVPTPDPRATPWRPDPSWPPPARVDDRERPIRSEKALDPVATAVLRELMLAQGRVESARRHYEGLTILWPIEERPDAARGSVCRIGALTNHRPGTWVESFRTDLFGNDLAQGSPTALAGADRVRAAIAVAGFVACLHANDIVCGRLRPHSFRLAHQATGVEVLARFDPDCRRAGTFPDDLVVPRFDFETDRVRLAAVMRGLVGGAGLEPAFAAHLPCGGSVVLRRLLASGDAPGTAAPRAEEWLVALGGPRRFP